MKKILILISISVLLLTGCGSKKVTELKHNKVNNGLSELEQINEEAGTVIISQDVDLMTRFGIPKEWIKDYIVGIPEYNNSGNLYIVIKSNKKYEKEMKNAVDNFLLSEQEIHNSMYGTYNNETGKYESEFAKMIDNALKTEYKGYYIVLVTSDNEEALKIIKNNL